MLGSGRSAGPAGESGRISEVLGFLDSHNAAPLFRLTAGKCDFLARISRPHFTRTTGAQSEGPMGQRGAWDGDVAPGAWARNNHLFLVGVRGFFDPAGRIAPQIPRLAKKTRRSAARSRRDANPIRLTRPDSRGGSDFGSSRTQSLEGWGSGGARLPGGVAGRNLEGPIRTTPDSTGRARSSAGESTKFGPNSRVPQGCGRRGPNCRGDGATPRRIP